MLYARSVAKIFSEDRCGDSLYLITIGQYMDHSVQEYLNKQDDKTLFGVERHIQRFKGALFLLGIVLPLILFFVLVDNINNISFLTAERAFLWSLRTYAEPMIGEIADEVSTLVTVISLCILAYLMYLRLWRVAFFWLVAIGGAAILGSLIKTVIQRTRPDLWLAVFPHTSFGFPSGHATQSMAIALASVILLRGKNWAPMAVAAGVGFVLLVGASRMYLGYHYPTDILAGWMLSFAWVTAVAMLFNARYLTIQSR